MYYRFYELVLRIVTNYVYLLSSNKYYMVSEATGRNTMSTLQLPVPEEYSNEGDIELWINELENYMMAAGGYLPEERKKAILLACIGKQGRLVINNFQESQRSNYRSLVDSLKDHYKEVTNVIVERHIFLYHDSA